MEALVLEEPQRLSLRSIDIHETVGPTDVRIALHTVGICGSDVHYYQHGRIGPFVVETPMVLGHEASGTVTEVGAAVTHVRVGDRVCMEPGVPDPNSRATRLGLYNLDPSVRFWATPPIHGVLRSEVVHPAAFTFKLPDTISFAEGAMVEPLAVGLHAINKVGVKPGDVALVTGAGPIGLLTVLAALAGGCSEVIITDMQQPKLDLAATLGAVTTVNITEQDLGEVVRERIGDWGVDIVFEASGNARAAAGALEPLRPGGSMVLIGMPGEPITLDVVEVQTKEATLYSVFRYAHVYPRALALMGSGQLDVKPLISKTFTFADSVSAFEQVAAMPPAWVKAQIELPQ